MSKAVIDFDHHSEAYGANPFEEDRRIQRESPVAWSEHHGGFWLVTSYEHAATVLRDWETFSNAKYVDDQGETHGGVTIPPIPELTAYPDEVDPPLWKSYRTPNSRLFAPAAIDRIRDRIESFTTEFIDRVIERGEGDLVLDIGNPVPAMVILDIMDLPLDDWKLYAEPYHEIVYAPVGSPVYQHAEAGIEIVAAKLSEALEARREAPGDGFIDNLIRARVDGQTIPDEAIVAICMDHLAGGVDTTSGMLANAFVYLDDHPEARERLRDDPEFLRLGTEEFLRWVAPIRMLARTATKDVELGGQQLHAGDRVLVSFSAANRDGAVFDDPDTVILDRFPNRHAGFGIGIHRCIGSNLARVVFQIVLREVLTRMPDYRVDRSRAQQYQTMSVVNGWITIPATFTPGPKKGSGLSLRA